MRRVVAAFAALAVAAVPRAARAQGADTARGGVSDSARAARADSLRADSAAAAGSLGPFVLPGVFYTPETDIGVGVGALWVRAHRVAGTRPSTYSVNAIATRNGQFTLAGSADAWTAGNRWHLTFDGTLSKYPYRFYGIGTANVDSGETYTPLMRILAVTVQRQLAPGVYVGVRTAYDDVDVSDVAPGAQLATATGATGWRLVTLGLMANRDTRDRLYWPSTGSFVGVTASRAFGHLGSTHPFSRYTVDARRYLTLTGEHILAVQGWGDFTDGLVPFDRLPQLGGQAIARGYLIGRFRDQQALALQGEYRSAPFRVLEEVPRVAVVAFLGAAATAPTTGAFATDRAHVSGGLGLRYALTLPDRYHLRLDYGIARGSSAFSITVGEAF